MHVHAAHTAPAYGGWLGLRCLFSVESYSCDSGAPSFCHVCVCVCMCQMLDVPLSVFPRRCIEAMKQNNGTKAHAGRSQIKDRSCFFTRDVVEKDDYGSEGFPMSFEQAFKSDGTYHYYRWEGVSDWLAEDIECTYYLHQKRNGRWVVRLSSGPVRVRDLRYPEVSSSPVSPANRTIQTRSDGEHSEKAQMKSKHESPRGSTTSELKTATSSCMHDNQNPPDKNTAESAPKTSTLSGPCGHTPAPESALDADQSEAIVRAQTDTDKPGATRPDIIMNIHAMVDAIQYADDVTIEVIRQALATASHNRPCTTMANAVSILSSNTSDAATSFLSALRAYRAYMNNATGRGLAVLARDREFAEASARVQGLARRVMLARVHGIHFELGTRFNSIVLADACIKEATLENDLEKDPPAWTVIREWVQLYQTTARASTSKSSDKSSKTLVRKPTGRPRA